jgi:hypothetical protein
MGLQIRGTNKDIERYTLGKPIGLGGIKLRETRGEMATNQMARVLHIKKSKRVREFSQIRKTKRAKSDKLGNTDDEKIQIRRTK